MRLRGTTALTNRRAITSIRNIPDLSDINLPDNMATATTIKLSLADAGVFSIGAREDSAKRASELLQEDMRLHHIFFNKSRFHNHIVHHLLTLFALGASPEEIQAAYDRGHSYQRTAYPVEDDVVHSIIEKGNFKDYLGKEEHYSSFLAYFQQEIDSKGVPTALQEHLFAEDQHADDMLARMFAGLIHPIIHLGFGIEFNQPAIIAQALAEAAVHENWIGTYLYNVEKAAGGVGSTPGKSLTQLVSEARQDKELAGSARWGDGNLIRDGTLKRAPQEMQEFAKQYTVSSDTLNEQLAEMINALVYCAAASQKPPKAVKFDFILIHALNCSVFFSAILSRSWISSRAKVRLLEWKGRMDLLLYVSRGTPPLDLEEITNYPTSKNWKQVFDAGNQSPSDDSHLVKLVRAIANGERVCKILEGQGKSNEWKMKGDAWLRAGNMGK
ncbi:putative HypA-like protein [Talaromyces proteolyticus]|uniref:HypA-like protein n=1 Tax=Talaromyces proteolyticus TaxID=1131652 RepID=A0AAD4KYI6_9EURO|nr:putative HypA-like protein [Talaromyces proteolyticus]KAH8702153.1 putative HypA-like protein [Talaromyces proteolyticus]